MFRRFRDFRDLYIGWKLKYSRKSRSSRSSRILFICDLAIPIIHYIHIRGFTFWIHVPRTPRFPRFIHRMKTYIFAEIAELAELAKRIYLWSCNTYIHYIHIRSVIMKSKSRKLRNSQKIYSKRKIAEFAERLFRNKIAEITELAQRLFWKVNRGTDGTFVQKGKSRNSRKFRAAPEYLCNPSPYSSFFLWTHYPT